VSEAVSRKYRTAFENLVIPATDAETHEGGGIGLSLAKKLVELNGGTIEARSRGRDMGSEFEVRLPVAPGGTAGERAITASDPTRIVRTLAPSARPDRR
jgi:K+-sensing histidine kinase KdpD